MNKRIVHDALILTAFTLVLGLMLGFVYELTKDRIAASGEESSNAAFQQVFQNADAFQALNDLDTEKASTLVQDAGYNDTIDGVSEAVDGSGNLLGYVITVTAKDGSQGSITFSVGIQTDGTVNGYSITESAETPGLGLKAEEPEFYSQFENKKVTEFVVVKTGASADNEIDAIANATITSEAVAKGCNAALYYFRNALGGAQ